MKKRYEDYTEAEFLELLKDICLVRTESQNIHTSWVDEFVEVSEYPTGSAVIFYPEDDEDDSPEGILNTVKKWRAANGKPGFK